MAGSQWTRSSDLGPLVPRSENNVADVFIGHDDGILNLVVVGLTSLPVEVDV